MHLISKLKEIKKQMMMLLLKMIISPFLQRMMKNLKDLCQKKVIKMKKKKKKKKKMNHKRKCKLILHLNQSRN